MRRRPEEATEPGVRSAASVSAAEAEEIAADTYVYAYPLVLSELTRRARSGKAGAPPINEFHHTPADPGAISSEVPWPNADTLYSSLWFDISRDPLAITVPDSGGRHYRLPMLDLWTDAFACPGSRTTSTDPQLIVVARASWRGQLPLGAMLTRSPTLFGRVFGRTQARGVSDDPPAGKFQSRLIAMPLSAARSPHPTPTAAVDPDLDLITSSERRIERLTPKQFFGLFADLIAVNPPHEGDDAIVRRMARIGLVPGRPFQAAWSHLLAGAFERAASSALDMISTSSSCCGSDRNGWRLSAMRAGDYRARAALAHLRLAGGWIDEGITAMAFADSDGEPLSSDKRYTIHLTREQLPPAHVSWSLTMYDARHAFGPNPIDRYALSDRDDLRYNADGSLDLRVQRDAPADETNSNWLPAPPHGHFTIVLRLPSAQPESIDDGWAPPSVHAAR